ncbi:MAG: diguanylate cyclase [Betaproteobacteria bacterium]|nr:diguanylate cyclase [Betaproteobacteria bacterium]
MKLLIAEDDFTSRTMLAAIAKKWGHETIAVEDGEAAWKVLLGEDPPQLLLLDWEMPLVDGLELCHRIRQLDTQDHPYIILLTSRNESADIVEGLQAGSNDYIAKPFENTVLHARIEVGCRMLKLQAELKQIRDNLAFLANHDGLTGLMNRRAVMQALEKEIYRTQRTQEILYIALCDIDHFKQVNDTYGHLVGDAVLKEVANRMTAVLRPYDHIGRYGGEEFLIVLNTCSDQIFNTFERLRLAIAETQFEVEHLNLNITMSFGISILLPTAEKRDAVSLIASADKSLYKAKEIGRNCIVSLKQ